MDVEIYLADGTHLEQKFFNSIPLVGDVLLAHEGLAQIVSRRWTDTGRLEIIIDFI